MKESQLELLLTCTLFKNISQTELKNLLPCLNTVTKTFHENEIVFAEGDIITYIYIILEGQIEITKSHFSGQKNIVSVQGPGQLFGEGIVCTTLRQSPVAATSLHKTLLLCIPYNRIIGGCEHQCSFHHQLIYNMMLLLGEKNYELNHKMNLLLLKGLREKLTTYLLIEAYRQGSYSFTLPMNRNQLAEYLNVSRPSMCRELGRMKEEKLIDYYQSSFKLLDIETLKKFS